MSTKKTFRILAALMFAVCIIFALSSCDAFVKKECEHKMVETAEKAATCEEAGNVKYFTCSECKKVYLDKEGKNETTLDKTVVAAKGHTEEDVAAVAPTCTATGLTAGKKCSVCDKVLAAQETVAALGHTAGAEATCTTAQTCTVCNEVLVAALGHTEVVDAAVAATCTETGLTEGKHCSVCNEVLVAQEEVAALGHELIDIVAKEPNCTEEGYTAHKACTRCSYTEGKEILPIQHARVDGAGLAPTCVLPGYTDYWYCSKCFETFDLVDLAPLGHTLVDVAAKEATCFTDGYNAHQECSVCSHTVGKVVVPADHTGTWTADGNNEYILCTVCDKKFVREKNVVLDFADNKISEPLSLKPGTEGRLAVTVEDAVIKCIADKEAYDAETGNPSFTLMHTDAEHGKDGKYLVFEFDVKLGKGTNTTSSAFVIVVKDEGGNGGLAIPVATYNNTVKLNNVALDNIAYVADDVNGTWMTLRLVAELATEKAEDGNYVSNYSLYYKHKDSDETMKKAGNTVTLKSGYTGHTGRTDAYRILLTQIGGYVDQTYWLDNMTFFRTNDSNYLYSACAHELADWQTVSAPTCKADGVYTRKCTVEGCGYVETAYAPAGAHTAGEEVAAKAPTCGVAGHTAYNICPVCETKVGYEVVPATGHDISDWTDIEGGKQKKTCANGCGYYELRTVLTDAPITFDDATITSGSKITYPAALTVAEDNKSAVDAWGYATWAVSTTVPLREGQTALRIQTTKANWDSGRGTSITFATTDGSTEGNVYTFDFDMYIEPGADASNGSSRVVAEIYFNGSKYSLGTYGSRVTRYAQSFSFGTTLTWISFRFEYTVEKDGEAALVVYVKDAEGNYNKADSITVKSSDIKVGAAGVAGFGSYAGANSFTYYLDNISFTRRTVACEHTYTDWTVTQAPACEVAGTQERTCKWCGAKDTESITALVHEYGEWVTTKEPTSCVDGEQVATCSICGGTKTQALPSAGEHSFGEWTVTTPATCTTDGEKSRTCPICNTTEKEAIPAGHSFGEWTGTDATCTTDGEKSRTCSVCSTVETKTIAAAHTGAWVNVEGETGYEEFDCSACDYYEKREKNSPFDFEGDTIPQAAYKFDTTVGKGEGSVAAAAGLTEFGNARDKFSLADDAGNKVLHIVGKNNTNYGASSFKVWNTDALHNANANADGGQYLVFDFDMKFDAFDGINSGKKIFTLTICEGGGTNALATFDFTNYNSGNSGKSEIRVGATNFVLNESGSSSDTWFSFRVVTTLTPDANSKAVTNIYYKVKGSDSNMKLLASATVGTASYGTVTRTAGHYAQFSLGANDYDYSYYFDNMSLIRTNDASCIPVTE